MHSRQEGQDSPISDYRTLRRFSTRPMISPLAAEPSDSREQLLMAPLFVRHLIAGRLLHPRHDRAHRLDDEEEDCRGRRTNVIAAVRNAP